MASQILPSDLDYTARDFEALNTRLERATDSVFPNWSDKSRANFGNILREMVAYVGDVMDKYIQAQAVESRFTTCTRRINGVRHARPLGYKFAQQTAGTADIVFAIAGAYNDIAVAAGSVIRSQSATNPARFQVLVDDVIPAGQSAYAIACENSLTYVETFESDDSANQELFLIQSPYLEVVSIVDDLNTYTEVDTYLDSTGSDAHFIVLLSDANRALVRFGDGSQGQVPNGTVTVTYKTGGGSVTVNPDTLVVAEFSLEDSVGAPVAFSVSNPAAAVSGTDRETLAEAQEAAPATLRLNQRSVTWGDYKTVAEAVSGVSRAIILTADQMVGIDENYGQLYVVARGVQLSSGAYAPTTPSQATLDAVRSEIDNDFKSTITFEYDVIAGLFETINIEARVRLDEGATAATVDAAIRSNLADYFAVVAADGTQNNAIGFGFEYKDELGAVDNKLPWSDLFGVVLNTTGVRSVAEDIFVPLNFVTIPFNALPALGTVALINDRTGLALV